MVEPPLVVVVMPAVLAVLRVPVVPVVLAVVGVVVVRDMVAPGSSKPGGTISVVDRFAVGP